MLKFSFWMLGEQPIAVLALNTLLGFIGIWALADAIKREGCPNIAAAAIGLLTFYPILITYQHTLLTDSGIFCCLAVMLNATLWRCGFVWQKTAVLVAAITFSYYFRPNLLYMGPVMAVLSALLLSSIDTAQPGWRALFRGMTRRAALHAALVMILPFILSWPWKYLAEQQEPGAMKKRLDSTLVVFIFNQLVVHPGEPLVGPELSPKFEALINDRLKGGHLPLDGIGGSVMDLALQRADYFSEHSSLAHEFSLQPVRYSKGVVRTTLLFCGFQGASWPENKPFMRYVMPAEKYSDATLMSAPQMEPEMRAHFTQKTGCSVISRVLPKLNPLYDILVILGSIAGIIGLLVGVCRADVPLIVFTAMPAAFIAMHALTLLSGERYAFPVYGMALANLVFCPVRIFSSPSRIKELIQQMFNRARTQGRAEEKIEGF